MIGTLHRIPHLKGLQTVAAVALLLGLMLAGCTKHPTPRPRGYHRLTFPEHTYQTFAHPGCPFTFEYPVYGKLDTARIDSCFFNIRFGDYESVWHITSRFFDGEEVTYPYTFEDHRAVVYHHAQKGPIYEEAFRTPEGHGMYYSLEGEIPTYAQVYFTDSVRYAVMSHCYFNTATKNDSLAPVIDFLKTDLEHLLQTFRWK